MRYYIIEPSIRELDSRIKEGFNFIAYSLDIRMLSHNARSFGADKVNIVAIIPQDEFFKVSR